MRLSSARRRMGEMAVSSKEWRWALTIALLAVGLSAAPFIYAYLTTPPALHFSGLLVNAGDGYSYLAKMAQGARGEWLFRLPFTPESHEGGLIFTFYLALGHLASALGLPLILVFHLARIAAGLALLLVGYAFIAAFSHDAGERRLTFVLLAFSSGLGWLMLPTGHLTSDLSIPESITFYSVVVNPHFPLAMALLLLTLLGVLSPSSRGWGGLRRIALLILVPLALVAIQPFVFITLAVVLGLYVAWRWLGQSNLPTPIQTQRNRTPMSLRRPAGEVVRAALALAAATPVVLYDYWLLNANPVMRAWTAQNLTPSPPPWDYLLGYGVIVVLAALGAREGLRQRDERIGFLVIWVAATALLLYAPFALQRRLSFGLHIPLAILAGRGVYRVVAPRLRRRRRLVVGLVGATMLTNAVLLLILFVGAAQHDAQVYLGRDEWAALGWLRESVPAEAVILAGPESGLFIPAQAGQRVVYGHPFETVNAATRRARVEDYFAGRLDAAAQSALLRQEGVGWVWLGPRERALSAAVVDGEPSLVCLTPATMIGSVALYHVDAVCLATGGGEQVTGGEH